jgi:hypothetical protein
MRKEGITKHEAILKAKGMVGCNGQPFNCLSNGGMVTTL